MKHGVCFFHMFRRYCFLIFSFKFLIINADNTRPMNWGFFLITLLRKCTNNQCLFPIFKFKKWRKISLVSFEMWNIFEILKNTVWRPVVTQNLTVVRSVVWHLGVFNLISFLEKIAIDLLLLNQQVLLENGV